ncbi:uncharacterized protein LOC124281281 [Haliotis rubra]|uniref:uncharacterized protein LOC124281281 n=1 Tax=Haliotis rubra TaxID=36100 RepID=UPI001EE52588|nr:uncharacterized protein LOC124281281 [Haliotis rubra]
MGVIDLDTVVRKWVENRVGVGNASNKAMDIDWHRVHFSTVSSNCYESTQYQQQRYGARGSQNTASGRSQVVFTSNYENNTGEVQSHTFQMERSTDAVVRTSLTNGFSKGGDVGINVDVPDTISKATASFGNDVQIQQQDDNTVKHAVKWSLNSTVRAQPHSRTTAKLCVTETESEFDFDAEVHIRGTVLVKMTNGGAAQTVSQGTLRPFYRTRQIRADSTPTTR